MPKNYNPAQAMTPQQIASLYNRSMLQNIGYANANQTFIHTFKQAIDDWQLEREYCVDGKWMNLEEFVNYIYPEDCSEKTYLILKLQGKKDED